MSKPPAPPPASAKNRIKGISSRNSAFAPSSEKAAWATKTLQALKEHGAVYLNAIGGAAQYYADCITSVDGVDFMEFGVPEAMWHLQVKDFAAIVTMDAHGNSLHEDVDKTSLEKLAELKDPVF